MRSVFNMAFTSFQHENRTRQGGPVLQFIDG
jgi:hypothetical protein